LNTGAENPNTISSSFNTAVNDYITANPNNALTKYVQDYLKKQTGTTTGKTTTGTTTTDTTKTDTTKTGTTIDTTAEKSALFKSMVDKAYASIGRVGSNIDQAGYNSWLDKLQKGELTTDDFNKTFYADVAKYLSNNPNDPVTKTVLSAYDKMIKDAYATYGRKGFGDAVDQIDQAGYDYWLNKLKSGEITPDKFNDIFTVEAKKFIKENPGDKSTTWEATANAKFDAANFDPNRAQKESTVVTSTGQAVPARDFVVSKPTVDYSKIGYPSSDKIREASKKP